MTFTLPELLGIIGGLLTVLAVIFRALARTPAQMQEQRENEIKEQVERVEFEQRQLEKVVERFMGKVEHLEKTIAELSSTFKEWTRFMRDTNRGQY